jgi:hypothetical protein
VGAVVRKGYSGFGCCLTCASSSPPTFTLSRVALASTVFIFIVFLGGTASAAWDYWIIHGGNNIVKCEGNSSGGYVKLANRDNQWIYIEGVAVCKDTGDNYVLDIKFLRVTINSSRSADIDSAGRNPLVFDWLGLEVYRQMEGQQRIDWLYHDEKPIQGLLANQPDKVIYFGKLQFVLPKAVVNQATRFTFYLTAQGIPFVFEKLL